MGFFVGLMILLGFTGIGFLVAGLFTFILCLFIGFDKWWVIIPITVITTTILLFITGGV